MIVAPARQPTEVEASPEARSLMLDLARRSLRSIAAAAR